MSPSATKVAAAEAVVFFGKGPIARADQPLPALGYLAPEFQKRPGPVRRVVRPGDLQGKRGRARTGCLPPVERLYQRALNQHQAV